MSDDAIFNPDGSTYMTFLPAQPSTSDMEGWLVKTITSADTRNGTFALHRADCESFNSLLRHVNAYERTYGHRANIHTRIGQSSYRWAWETLNPDGTRQSDTVIASKIY